MMLADAPGTLMLLMPSLLRTVSVLPEDTMMGSLGYFERF